MDAIGSTAPQGCIAITAKTYPLDSAVRYGYVQRDSCEAGWMLGPNEKLRVWEWLWIIPIPVPIPIRIELTNEQGTLRKETVLHIWWTQLVQAVRSH
jgi:hypothetical protein